MFVLMLHKDRRRFLNEINDVFEIILYSSLQLFVCYISCVGVKVIETYTNMGILLAVVLLVGAVA